MKRHEEDGSEEEVPFDVENVMAEIKVAGEDNVLVELLSWCVSAEDAGTMTDAEVKIVMEAVYSFARDKNEGEEARMMEGQGD